LGCYDKKDMAKDHDCEIWIWELSWGRSAWLEKIGLGIIWLMKFLCFSEAYKSFGNSSCVIYYTRVNLCNYNTIK
jgi:hypothetical protein